MAESSSLAMLEVLAGYDVAEAPATFQLLEIEADDDMMVTDWPIEENINDTALTADWGDAFLRANKTALARVPSVIAPQSWNCLLNPLHPDAGRVRLVRTERWPWDTRLFDR
jgi:RES domain-containing protein